MNITMIDTGLNNFNALGKFLNGVPGIKFSVFCITLLILVQFGGMKSKVEEIRKKAVPILREAGVTRSSLFGSVVRGEARKDSDIDMLVELPIGISLFDFVGLQLKLEQVLNRKVDLGEFSTIKPRLRDYILKGAVQIL